MPKSYIGPGNKRLVHPDGGTEPLGNRIIEVPEDEEVVVYRDPMSGFVAYVPKGSIAKGKELAITGDGGKTIRAASATAARCRAWATCPQSRDAIPTTSFASSGTCRTANGSARRRR